MFFRVAADGVLLLHLAFIVFVVFGAGLVFRWRWLLVLHLPAAIWGIVIELTGGVCPLTYLENDLRRAAGQAGYSEGFIEHYLLSIIYPEGLVPGTQIVLAGIVFGVNLLAYGGLVYHRYVRRGE
ncbi:DUF2784 domain-containing protein [Methylomonas sp. MgM2]